MGKEMKVVAVTMERRSLRAVRRRARELFGPRGLSQYIRHVVAADIKRGLIR